MTKFMVTFSFSWWDKPKYDLDVKYSQLGQPIKVAAFTLVFRLWRLGLTAQVDTAHHVLEGRKPDAN